MRLVSDPLNKWSRQTHQDLIENNDKKSHADDIEISLPFLINIFVTHLRVIFPICLIKQSSILGFSIAEALYVSSVVFYWLSLYVLDKIVFVFPYGSCFHFSWNVISGQLFTLGQFEFRVLLLLTCLQRCHYEEDTARSNKHEEQYCRNDDLFVSPFSVSEVAVLPDDVRGLGRLVYLDFLLYTSIKPSRKCVIYLKVLKRFIKTRLGLKSHKDVAWSSQLFEFLVFQVVDFCLNLCLSFQVLILYSFSSLFEQIYDPKVVEGNSSRGNLDHFLLDIDIFVKEIWLFFKTFFHLVFDPSPEAVDVRFKWSANLSALLLPIFFLLFYKVFVESGLDFKLESVVAGRDCIYVVLDIFVLLQTLDVVDIVDDKQGNKDCSACDNQTLLLTDSYVLGKHLAGNLYKYLGEVWAALIHIEAWLGFVDKLVELVFYHTRRLSGAVIIQPLFYFVSVQIRAAVGRVFEWLVFAVKVWVGGLRDDASVENRFSCVFTQSI